MKNQYTFLLFITLFFASCSDDGFLSVEEDASNIPFSTAPTITAFLCPQDTVHKVTLSHTRPVVGKDLSREWNNNVSKSIVTINDGTQTVKLTSGGAGTFNIKAKEFKVEAGKTYKLNVTTYDGQKAEATCTIPQNIADIKQVRIKEVSDVKFETKKYLVTWQDIPNEQNYYAVYVLTKYVSVTNKYVSVDQEDFENSITDQSNDKGKMVTKKSFYMTKRENYNDGSYRATEVQILNTDVNFYRYHKDLDILKISGDNPLVEPINVYSNIKGGFGVFAGYTRARGIYN
ncbi:MAG: DUF4249 domain-containing protein [Arcicella sp.]|nr:DUF4249 domain-containing protein [Arcicella sp.]